MSCHPVYYIKWSEITKGYGWLEYDANAEAYHPAFDYNKNKGNGGDGDFHEPVHAVKRGIVRVVYEDGGYGKQIMLEHEDGTWSKYAHLDKFLVVVGQMVEEGEIIGLMGKTGTSSVHCHHEMLTNKLIAYLKSIRKDFWNFYPKGRTKEWVAEYYINPLEAHTYSPPIIVMNIKTIVLIDNTIQYSKQLLATRLNIVRDYYKSISGNTINFQFETKDIKVGEPSWDIRDDGYGVVLTDWSKFYLIPHASGFDVSITWLPPTKWKAESSLAYSQYERILGVHSILTRVTENYTDGRWEGRYDSAPFTGIMAHENGHMLNQRTGSSKVVNNTDKYEKFQDNTHYFDFIVKDLSGILQDINIQNFKGWNFQEGYKRLFKYGGFPSFKKWEFSGNPEIGKIYRSTDSRMFFEYTSIGWKSIGETEFNTRQKQGNNFGSMAVQEANKIQVDILKLPLPGYSPKSILERVVQNGSDYEVDLKAQGWTESIPNSHLI